MSSARLVSRSIRRVTRNLQWRGAVSGIWKLRLPSTGGYWGSGGGAISTQKILF